MSRRYQKVQEFLPQIKQMLEQGMSQREVAESIGLKGERPAPARDAGGAAQRGAGPFEWLVQGAGRSHLAHPAGPEYPAAPGALPGGCWWAGLNFNRGPARCAGPLSRKNPKKPRRGFVAHDFGTKV